MMNGRHMVFTNGLAEKGRGGYASADVLAEAKAMTVPTIVSRVIEARERGEFTLACALSLDMVIHRIRTVHEGYLREKQKANEKGETGLMFEIDREWWGCRPEEEGPDPLRSMAERMVAETLFEIYDKSKGALGHEQWNRVAEGIREDLIGSVSERIAKTGDSTADLLSITVQELDLVSKIWIAGFEQAEIRVCGEEKKHSGKQITMAS